jgi:positive regulator of sigma E activity
MLRRALSRLANWIEPDHNPSAQIYGTLAVAALLAAESTRQETLSDTIGAVAVTLLLYWLAHAYATALAERLATGQRWSVGHLIRIGTHEWALIKGAALPLLTLVVAWAVGATTNTAVLDGLIAAVVLIIALELVAGIRGKLSAGEITFQVAIGAVISVGVLALRVLLH